MSNDQISQLSTESTTASDVFETKSVSDIFAGESATEPVAEQLEDVEEWRLIGGFDNYSVSSLGQVRNDRTGRILRPGLRNGYYAVTLCKNGIQSTKPIHKLVATGFLGDSDGREVNHRNINPLDNRLTNLEYCTRSENEQSKTTYRGRRVQYVQTLSPEAVPYTEHNGFALQSGYWRDGNSYYRKVSAGFRRITATPRHRKIQIALKFENGRSCSISVDP